MPHGPAVNRRSCYHAPSNRAKMRLRARHPRAHLLHLPPYRPWISSPRARRPKTRRPRPTLPSAPSAAGRCGTTANPSATRARPTSSAETRAARASSGPRVTPTLRRRRQLVQPTTLPAPFVAARCGTTGCPSAIRARPTSSAATSRRSRAVPAAKVSSGLRATASSALAVPLQQQLLVAVRQRRPPRRQCTMPRQLTTILVATRTTTTTCRSSWWLFTLAPHGAQQGKN